MRFRLRLILNHPRSTVCIDLVSGPMINQENRTSTKKRARAALERGCELYEKRQFKAAKEKFEAGHRLGNREATVNLGNIYDSNEGGPRNRRRAIQLYKHAAAAGISYGAYNLSQLYRIEGNSRWYMYWLKKAHALSDRATRKFSFTSDELKALRKASR